MLSLCSLSASPGQCAQYLHQFALDSCAGSGRETISEPIQPRTSDQAPKGRRRNFAANGASVGIGRCGLAKESLAARPIKLIAQHDNMEVARRCLGVPQLTHYRYPPLATRTSKSALTIEAGLQLGDFAPGA